MSDRTVRLNGVEIDSRRLATVTDRLADPNIDEEMLILHLLESEATGRSALVATKQKSKAKRRTNTYDLRGLELRNYMGSIRPYYQRLSEKKRRILRVELDSYIAVLVSLYPSYPRHVFPEEEDLDIVHTYYENFNQYSSALINAAYYRQAIIVGSAIIEGIAVNIGFKKIEGYTKAQVQTLPIYESLVLALSRKHGAGLVEGFPVEMKLAFMMLVSLVMYGLINYLLPTGGEVDNRINLFSNVMNGLNNMYTRFTAGAATPAPPPVEGQQAAPAAGAGVAAPVSAIPPPSTAAPSLDIPGMISSVMNNFGPMLSNLNLGQMLSQLGGGAQQGAAVPSVNSGATRRGGARTRTGPIR